LFSLNTDEVREKPERARSFIFIIRVLFRRFSFYADHAGLGAEVQFFQNSALEKPVFAKVEKILKFLSLRNCKILN